MAGAQTLLNLPYNAGGALVRHRFVKLSGNEEVVQASVAGERCVGVGGMNVSADEATKGKGTFVAVYGVAFVEASAAIARGALVTTAVDGRGATSALGNIPLGIALTPAGAAGDLLTVLLTPGLPAQA